MLDINALFLRKYLKDSKIDIIILYRFLFFGNYAIIHSMKVQIFSKIYGYIEENMPGIASK
jgi:hypothetical protein